ncbi:YSIRK-type signal peptide-containing protein, partial [Enterococcus cecorum]
MIKKQRFSIRKFKTGVGSVLLATVIFGVPMFTDQTQMSSSIVFADTIDKSSLKQSDWTREDAALITQYYLQEGATGLTQKRVEDLIDWYNGSAKIKTLIPNYSINYSYFNDVLKGDMANPTSFNDTFINRVISAYSTRAIDSFKTEIDKKIDELKKSPNADKYSNIINQLEDIKNGITADKIINDSAGLAKQLNDLISEEALNNALNNDSSKSDAKAAIDEALAKKKEEIANSKLTDAEKATANKKAEDAANAAKTA